MSHEVWRSSIAVVAVFVLAIGVLTGTALPAAAAPTNDDFADAIEITALPFQYAQDVASGTRETDEPSASCDIADQSATIWYEFTPSTSRSLAIDTGPGYAFAYAAVYEGASLAGLTEVACSRFEVETFSVIGGTTYYLQVGGYDSTSEALSPKVLFGRPSTISGTVEDTQSAPLSDMTILVYQSGESMWSDVAASGVDGSFTLDLVEGSWDLWVVDNANQYGPEWYQDATSQGVATPVIAPADGVTDITVVLGLGATVTGEATDMFDGAPGNEGDYVYAILVEDESAFYNTPLLVDGSYEISGVPAGTYAVYIDGGSPYGSQWSDGQDANVVDIADAPHLVVTEGATHTVDITLVPSHIAGTVLDGRSSLPAAGVPITILRNGVDEVTASTASDGTYLVPLQSDGDYGVRFGDGVLYETEWYDDAPNLAAALEFQVADGEAVTGIDATLEPVNVAPVAPDEVFEVAESTPPGGVVGIYEPTDPNGADTLTMTVTGGTGAGAFALGATTGVITTAIPLDLATTPTYTLMVEVSDDNLPALSDTATLTIEVLAAANHAPVANDAVGTVSEDVPVGTDVATVAATDQDGDPLTFAITGGNIGDIFAIDGTSGAVTTAAALDYETSDRYVLAVEVSDGFLTDEAEVSVTVTDVDEGVPSAGFVDTVGSVFETDIDWLASEGITYGCNPPLNDRFCPSSVATRGQMAAFLGRALGLTDRGTVDFVDDDGSTFEADIERLAAAGITFGCNPPLNDRFCPSSVVTRGQMAAFLGRALGLTDPGTVDFVDDDGSTFEADIERLAAAGITYGCNPPLNDKFCPANPVTREQMAAFLHRAFVN